MAEKTTDFVMTVDRRETFGKETTGRLRKAGKIPGVVYGGGKEPVPIVVNADDVKVVLRQESGGNSIFLLKLSGTKHERRAMIKEMQRDPLTGAITHLDFIRVVKGHKLTVNLPVELEGDSVGVRHGGVLDFVSRELALEVLPRELPDRIVVDISDLEVGHHVTVGDLESMLPPSGRFLDEPQRVVVTIGHVRGFQEEEEAAAAEAALLTADQAEPEVIGRGHEDEDEDEQTEE